jgi:hypothetical protein
MNQCGRVLIRDYGKLFKLKGGFSMTYNFDPERWYENEYSALKLLYKQGEITDIKFEEMCSDLLDRYEEMVSRLDGTYQLPK